MAELLQAADTGDLAAVARLLAAGAPADAQNSDGWTALHIAAFHGNCSVLAALLGAKANPNSTDHRGWCPLHIAAQEGHREAARALVHQGASHQAATANGNTALHVAAQEGHAGVVLALLEGRGIACIASKNTSGQTPLHCAAFKGRMDAVQALLARGAEPGPADVAGDTPLHRVAHGWRRGHEAALATCATALVGAGADPDAKDSGGKTAAQVAEGRGYGVGFAAAVAEGLKLLKAAEAAAAEEDPLATRRNAPGKGGMLLTRRNIPGTSPFVQSASSGPLRNPHCPPLPPIEEVQSGSGQRALAAVAGGSAAAATGGMSPCGSGPSSSGAAPSPQPMSPGSSGSLPAPLPPTPGGSGGVAVAAAACAFVASAANGGGAPGSGGAGLAGGAWGAERYPAVTGPHSVGYGQLSHKEDSVSSANSARSTGSAGSAGSPSRPGSGHTSIAAAAAPPPPASQGSGLGMAGSGSGPLSPATSSDEALRAQLMLLQQQQRQGQLGPQAAQQGFNSKASMVDTNRNHPPGMEGALGMLGSRHSGPSMPPVPEAGLGPTGMPAPGAGSPPRPPLQRNFETFRIHPSADGGCAGPASPGTPPTTQGPPPLQFAPPVPVSIGSLVKPGAPPQQQQQQQYPAVVQQHSPPAPPRPQFYPPAQPLQQQQQHYPPVQQQALSGPPPPLAQQQPPHYTPVQPQQQFLPVRPPPQYPLLQQPALPSQSSAAAELAAALRKAVQAGDTVGLCRLLGSNPGLAAEAANFAGPDGHTPLHAAAVGSSPEALRALLDAGGNPSMASAQSGSTALHMAVKAGRGSTVEVLVSRMPDCNQCDLLQNTPLHVAAVRGHVAAVLALLHGGANPNVANYKGATPLHVAASDGRATVLAALISGGADVNARDGKGVTPIMLAAAAGHLSALRTLVRAGANAQLADAAGNSALHQVVLSWQGERAEAFLAIVQELLIAGCDVEIPNKAGESALALAGRLHASALKKLLTEASGGLYVESLRQSVRPTGVRGFWLQALRRHPVLAQRILPKDAEVLQYLSEVHYQLQRNGEMAHRFLFMFSSNPFFKNRMLAKQYPVKEEPAGIKGTPIEWLPGHAPSGQSASASRPALPLAPGEGFFCWFKALQVGDGRQLSWQAMQAVQQDCAIAQAINDVLQRPQDWHSGAALRELQLQPPAGGAPPPPPPQQQLPPPVQPPQQGLPPSGAGPSARGLAPPPQPPEPAPPLEEPKEGCGAEHGPVEVGLPLAELVRSIVASKRALGSGPAASRLAQGKQALADRRYATAAQHFEAAMDQDFEGQVKAEAVLGRAAALLEMHQDKEAKNVAELAVTLNPNDARAHVAEGLARMATQDWKLAKRALKAAKALSPDYPDIYELIHTCRQAITLRWGQRIKVARAVIGPMVALGFRILGFN